MDLHPDAEVASGMLRDGSVPARLLEWANRIGYRRADFIVDLGPYMKRRLVEKGVAEQRLHTVHVWSTKEEIRPTVREENPIIDALRLRDKFVVMYSGNAGIVHDFDDICEAMRLLRDDPRIYFLFVGDGPRRAEIERFARDHDIRNFQYRGYFERDQLRYSLSAADVHLISLRAPFVGISVPGKLYGIMASARPALFVGPERCESAETVVQASCGAVVDPQHGDGAARIAAILRRWSEQPEEVRAIGARGRQAFLATYERTPNCRAFAEVINAAWPARVSPDVTEGREMPAGTERALADA
jgi:glycosyltransferase involved in cell wall biosynthesis